MSFSSHFSKCPNVPVWFIYVWHCFRVLSSFPLGAFCVNLSSFGCLFPPALFSYSAPPVHSFPHFSWICLLQCYLFIPLVRSLLLLYLSTCRFFPFLMFLLPLPFLFQCNPLWSRGTIFLPCPCKRDPPYSHALIPFCYSFFFLPYLFSSSSYAFSLYLLPGSKCFAWQGHARSPAPHLPGELESRGHPWLSVCCSKSPLGVILCLPSAGQRR